MVSKPIVFVQSFLLLVTYFFEMRPNSLLIDFLFKMLKLNRITSIIFLKESGWIWDRTWSGHRRLQPCLSSITGRQGRQSSAGGQWNLLHSGPHHASRWHAHSNAGPPKTSSRRSAGQLGTGLIHPRTTIRPLVHRQDTFKCLIIKESGLYIGLQDSW